MPAARTSSSVRGFGCSPVMSTPTSVNDATDGLFSLVPGYVPTDRTCTLSPAWWRSRPAAICDLPPFLTHTNNTCGR